ncbi:MAG: hypothetical protein IKP68_01175 [Clostridia bacterium]|nr:hypothetical protein [Clostridia bacterium]
MNDNRNTVPSLGHGCDAAYIDTDRILDSCRDKDCYEDVPVYLCEPACELLEHSTSVRTKKAEVVASAITVEPVAFNRGFYQVGIRLFIHVVCEICAGIGRSQEVDGICFVDKKVILYGSEGNVNIFRSRASAEDFCSDKNIEIASKNLPTAVLEVVDPVVLGTKVKRADRCSLLEFPCAISGMEGDRLLSGRNNAMIVVSLGIFSVVRIERPAQYLVNGTEYTVPEKECVSPKVDDPCDLFKNMAFPVGQFSPPSLSELRSMGDGNPFSTGGGCGCGGKK